MATHSTSQTFSGTGPSSDVLAKLARPGLVARGVLYSTIGILAIQLALAGRSKSSAADGKGALRTLSEQPFGNVLLILMVVGLTALVLWHVAQAIWGDPVSGSEAKERVRYALKALAYGSLALSALGVLLGNGSGSSDDQRAQSWTATVMGWPFGRVLVAAVGAALIAYALYSFWKRVVEKSFMDELQRGEMSNSTERAIRRVGQAGFTGRSLVFALVGVFLIQAALTFDSDQANGLSQSLQELASSSWRPLLWVVAVGLFAYGLVSFALARYRRVA